MGAWGGIPPGLGVVEGGPLPYRPEALAKKKENEANALALDPVVKCFLPGVPRATYMPFPFQITQSAQYVAFTYGYDFASRVVKIGNEERGSGRFLDGLVERFVGRGYAGGGRDRAGGGYLV